MCFRRKKKTLSEKELNNIRFINKSFDFGLTGESDDDPNKWIDEMEAFDIVTDDDEDW